MLRVGCKVGIFLYAHFIEHKNDVRQVFFLFCVSVFFLTALLGLSHAPINWTFTLVVVHLVQILTVLIIHFYKIEGLRCRKMTNMVEIKGAEVDIIIDFSSKKNH